MNTVTLPGLDELAVRYRILPAVPTCSTVETARQRLAQVRSDSREYPEMKQDASSVHEYAKTLRENASTLANAIILAADAARFSSASSWDLKLAEGLQALSATLNLADSSVPTQQAIRDLFARTYPELAQATFGVERSRDGSRVQDVNADKWRTDVLLAIAQLPESAPDPVTESWAAWRERFAAFFLPNGPTEFTPAISDVRCAAAKAGPGPLLNLRLREMTLGAWNDAFFDSLTNAGTPLWLAIAALAGLGFGREISSGCADLIKHSKSPDAVQEFLKAASQRTVERRTAAFLIVQSDAQSMSREWKPVPSVAAISLTRDRWANLLSGPPRIDLQKLQIDWLLIEAAGPDDQIQRQLSTSRSSLLSGWPDAIRSLPFAWLLPRTARRFDTRDVCVVGPPDLLAAHAILLRSQSQSQA